MALPGSCSKLNGLMFRCQRFKLSQRFMCSISRTVPTSSSRLFVIKRSYNSVNLRCLSGMVISHHHHKAVNQNGLFYHCKKKSIHDAVFGLRQNSSTATVFNASNAASASQPDMAIAMSSMLEDSSSAVDAVNSIISVSEPTLSSLGLGLANWWPSGMVQAAFEQIHVGLDVPWWTAIVIGTICIRLAIFPLVILSQRNAIELQNNMPTMQRLQERMVLARRSGDVAEAMKASEELMNFMNRNKINPLKNLLVPMAQLPIFLSMYRGLNGMAELPVTSMQTGGLLWFTDLTVQDPFYALPLMTAATLLITIEIGVDGIKAGQMGSQQMKYFMRAMPVLVFPFILHFPAAMLCYWFTSNAFSLVQVLFLKIPTVRDFFNIPKVINHELSAAIRKHDVPKKGFIEGFRESYENMTLAARIEERQKLEALKLKESKKSSVSRKSSN